MGGSDPELRNSGAGSLCLWHAIINEPKHIQVFDFEGSMLEPVERFFRAFGAEQVPYFQVTRVKNVLVGAAMLARKILKGVLLVNR
ncbi:MAG: hypothetical protein WHS86_00445 [Desulfosoma sp.]